MFQAFYDSVWQQPVLLSVLPLASLFFLPRGRHFVAVYAWVISLETVIDAVLTSSVVTFPGGIGRVIGFAFVLLGDARLFAITERTSQVAPGHRWLWRAALLTAPVPLVQAGLIAVFPGLFENSRHTYLAYECLFILWLTAYRSWLLRQRSMRDSTVVFAGQLCNYALGYYALWALADLWILSGHDAGFLLRVVPNLLYYAVFVPFVLWTAPKASA